MTRHQIADALDLNYDYVNKAFQEAEEEHPELKFKDSTANTSIGDAKDYPLDMVFTGLSYLRNGKGLSELEKAIIKDEFTMRKPKIAKAIGIPGTEEFLEVIKRYPKKKCCSTCAYCIKSSIRNNKAASKPFCNYWERFLYKIKADPYKDYCKIWEYSNKEPLIFYTNDSPTNVDIYGNVINEVMGVDVSNFKSDGQGLVTDIGLDLSED
jgi:hypothetical protein